MNNIESMLNRTASKRQFPIGLPVALSLLMVCDVARAVSSPVKPVVDNVKDEVMTPIPYECQQLNPDSLLGRRVDINLNRGLLGAVDEDVYLKPYETGLEPRWPSGEYLGKFMEGWEGMYRYTQKPVLFERMQRAADVWVDKQAEDGWIGTGDRLTGWDVWEHKYTLLGLIRFYEVTGDAKYLKAASKIGDFMSENFGPGKFDLMVKGNWAMGNASILEPMTYLYRDTGNKKYLDFCNYIIDDLEGPTGPKIIQILTKGSGRVYDIIDTKSHWNNGRKGYEMLSCIIGMMRMYELTGNESYLATAKQCWQDIVENRLYITGTTTTHETFKPDHELPGEQKDQVGEGCVTAHWTFLNRVLFYQTGDPKYADEMERTVYNDLLAGQCPLNGFQSYFVPLNGYREYHLQQVWSSETPCCLSSVERCISRTPEEVWAKFVNDGLAVLLYNQATLKDDIKTTSGDMVNLSLTMETEFPHDGRVTIIVEPAKPAKFRIALRVPKWTREFKVTAGGHSYTGEPGTFLNLEREWDRGDRIQIDMDMNDRLVEGGPTYAGYYAILHGPQVLAVDSLLNKGDIDNVRIDPKAEVKLEPLRDVLPFGWVGTQAYTCSAIKGNDKVILVPFSDAGQRGEPQAYRTWIKGL